MDGLQLLRLVAVPFVLVAPGWCWTFLFDATRAADARKLDVLERLALAVAISLVAVPLTFLALGWGLGVPVTWWSATGILLVLCAAPFGIRMALQRRRARQPT